MRHSPWPWRVVGAVSPIILDAAGGEVAILSGDRRNAALIAHAPDLLRLVQQLHGVESWGDAERLRDVAEDLIRDCGEVRVIPRRDVIRLCYAAIERYYGDGDRAVLAAMLVWAHAGTGWILMGEA